MSQTDKKEIHCSSSHESNAITWPILKQFMVEGATFFIDCFDVYVMGLFVLIISLVYYDGGMTQGTDILLKIATPVGCLIGQFLCDTFTHKITQPVKNAGLMIVLASTLGQALCGLGDGVHLIAALFFWRVALGIGFTMDNPFRGIYNSPLASSATPKLVYKAIFVPIALGIVCGSAVSNTFSVAVKDLPSNRVAVLDYGWRIYQGLIFLPAAITLYFRMTERKQVSDSEKVLPSNASDETRIPEPAAPITWAESIAHFSKAGNLKILLGGMYTMLATNIVYWGINMNLGVIYTAVGFTDDSTPLQTNFTITRGVFFTSVCGLLPGYVITYFLVERIGRKNLQLIGFIGMTVLYCVLGFAFNQIKGTSDYLYIFLMALSNTFTTMTPNGSSIPQWAPLMTSTSSDPSPNGYYGAMGKLGYVVGQLIFILAKNIGGPGAFVPYLYQIFALLSLIAVGITVFLPNPQPFKKSN
ncbi:MFS general substrate transporter [Conidiobolus coronatus NRRL 28638]|uniref:MFS general substrate transporter n=1 Tax=Conidiobolus coronatus (strain ATCC 28846 / CBS 209.66 / NRRL 28638) TaxID=796925 RepID=A0A137PG82_CONC2|nr:MFS general substrate transporter [Conidiobolus coronatus NRRL 28638]|eukprot:KXN74009.1 MFS general substrate transporter [Conidiobolus coronatus NRRL 28638]